jgi:DNA-binding IclR family transcriptional regulator
MHPRQDYFSKTIEKGLRILALFDANRPRLALTEIARELGLNLTSTYRYVNTFVELGYLEKDQHTRILRLGPKAFAIGCRFLGGFDLLNVTRPLVDGVHQKYDISIDVAMFIDYSMNVIYRRDAKETLSFRLPTNSKAFHCTALGKAILAFLPPHLQSKVLEVAPLERKTTVTITTQSDLLNDLKRTRERGYSLANEEFMNGLLAIGCPILNSITGEVLGSISFDSNTIRHRIGEFEQEYSLTITDLCSRISDLISIA